MTDFLRPLRASKGNWKQQISKQIQSLKNMCPLSLTYGKKLTDHLPKQEKKLPYGEKKSLLFHFHISLDVVQPDLFVLLLHIFSAVFNILKNVIATPSNIWCHLSPWHKSENKDLYNWWHRHCKLVIHISKAPVDLMKALLLLRHKGGQSS